MNFSELKDQDVFTENERIGKVTDLVIDIDGWKITHIEIELTEKAVKKMLGTRT